MDRSLFMRNERQRIHRLAIQQNIQLHQIGLAIAEQLIVQRRVTLRARLELVIKVQDDFVERHLIADDDTRRIEKMDIPLNATAFLTELENRPI